MIEDIGTKTLHYIYDFGDGWEHTIKVEQLTDPEPDALYPRLIAATGRCPPEDCGGPWGYAEFLDAIRDPAHEQHVEIKEWIGWTSIPTMLIARASLRTSQRWRGIERGPQHGALDARSGAG